jgi:hypothetical protein
MFWISCQPTVGPLPISDVQKDHICVPSENKQDRQCTCHWHHHRYSGKVITITSTYEVWQKSNATGNAVHEPTKLLPPPSHGS